jgi:hypothetical protein
MSRELQDLMSPHGNATGLLDADAEQTRLCDQCGRWDVISSVRKVGGLSICIWCKPSTPRVQMAAIAPNDDEGHRGGGKHGKGVMGNGGKGFTLSARSIELEEQYQEKPEDYIGCCVERQILGHGMHSGTVTEYDADLDMFKVRYDDGHEQQYEEMELRLMIPVIMQVP